MSDNQTATLAVNRAIAEYRQGRPVIVRGAEGAVLALAAEVAAADAVAGLAALGAGEPLLALTAERARALNIKPSGHDVILLELSPWLNAETLGGLADATTDLDQPLRGPFTRVKRAPLAAEAAAITLAKRARLLPAAVVAKLPDDAEAADLLAVEAAEVERYEEASAATLRPVESAQVPLAGAENCRIVAFRPADGGVEHLALVIGAPKAGEPVLTRLHSECFTGDLLGSLKCDCGEQLRGAIKAIAEVGGGILLYLAQEGRGIGLINKLRAYRLQESGYDTVDANLRLGFAADERIFRPAAEMLRQLGYTRVRLMTNNPDKVAGLAACGIEVAERVPHAFPANTHNEFYLATKQKRGGHLF